jgi:hypothetical protein
VTRHLLDEVLDAKQQREERSRRVDPVAERVKRGAALLDEKRAGWWRDIDLARLDLRSGCDCVIGQVGGTLGYSATALSLGAGTTDEEVRLGFEAPEVVKGDDWDADVEYAEYEALTLAWCELILARRAAASVTA